MQNGLYRVHFQTPLGLGAGVVVIHDGTIRGGDASMYYRGTYEENGDQFTANVRSAMHTDVPGVESVFGVDEANINLAGTSTPTSATTQGTAAEAPDVKFQAMLERICD